MTVEAECGSATVQLRVGYGTRLLQIAHELRGTPVYVRDAFWPTPPRSIAHHFLDNMGESRHRTQTPSPVPKSWNAASDTPRPPPHSPVANMPRIYKTTQRMGYLTSPAAELPATQVGSMPPTVPSYVKTQQGGAVINDPRISSFFPRFPPGFHGQGLRFTTTTQGYNLRHSET